MAEESKEWWDIIEEALNDADWHFSEFGVDVLLEELEHLFAIRQRVSDSVGRCKKEIMNTIDIDIDDAKRIAKEELKKAAEGAQ